MARLRFALATRSPYWVNGSMSIVVAYSVGNERRPATRDTEITVSPGDVIDVENPLARAVLADLTTEDGTPIVTAVPGATPARERWDDKFESAEVARGSLATEVTRR